MILRWLGSLFLVLALALLVLAGWVLGTEAGSNWLARAAELLSGGAVRMIGVHGSLAEGLAVDELTVATGTTRLDGRALTLRLQPARLLRGRLSVVTIRAQHISVTLTPASQPTGAPFRMPVLSAPLPVEVEELGIGELAIHRGDSVWIVAGIGLSGSMRGTRIRLRGLHGALAGFELRGEGSVHLEPELPVNAHVEWRLADPALSGEGTVRGNLAALEFAQLVHVPDAVTVTGTIRDLASDPRVQAEASWPALAFNVPGLGGVQAGAGRATLGGKAGGWQATLATDTRTASLPPMRASATAHGDEERIVFDELRLDSASGTLAARGELTIAPPRRVVLDVKASNFDPAVFRPGLRGRLSADARLEAELPPGEIRVRVADLRGSLMDRPLAGSGDVAWREGLLSFTNVKLRAGPNRLAADGTLGDRLAGRIDLDAPELGILWPGLAGSLHAHATLAGTRAQPVVDLDADGRELRFAGAAAGSLALQVRVDRQQRVDATLAAHGVEVAGNALGDVAAGMQGTLDAHRLTAHLAGGRVEADVASAGAWNGTTLRHRIESARIATGELGAWQLSGEPEVSVQADAVTAGDHCWEQPPASLCLSGLSWSPAHTHLVAVLRDLDMHYFDRWLPEDFTVTGRAYAAASLDLTPAGPDGSAIWRQEDTTIRYTGGDEPLVTPLETAQVAAEFALDQVLATLELHAADGVQLSGTGSMHWPVGPEAPIEAHIAGQMPDIAPLLPVFAGDFDLADVAGSVSLDAGVSGTLAAPRVTGEVRLADGSLALVSLGVTLKDIDIALVGDGSESLKLQGSARAGGVLTLDGEVAPIGEEGPSAWVRIRGNKVDAVRLPDRYVQASPDLTLRYARGQLSTEGGVTIPRAEIVVRELPESAVSPSPDTVVHDSEATEQSAGGAQRIGGEFAVTLGPDVRLKAFGLDTLLEGTVKLSQGADGEMQGYGVVRLKEGKFGAYGKELTIERGTLGFAGPLDDPSIELRASRRVEWEGRTVTAGVMVTGTVNRPESRVFSDPAMSEVDALSYLISGRPMQSTSANDRSSIAGAALALGVQQTSPLTQALGSAVTLDELGVQGSTIDETEVVAGKQLGSDLYVRFTYGLFNRIGTVLARYKLGHNFSIEAASGEDESLDLIYSVEKD